MANQWIQNSIIIIKDMYCVRRDLKGKFFSTLCAVTSEPLAICLGTNIIILCYATGYPLLVNNLFPVGGRSLGTKLQTFCGLFTVHWIVVAEIMDVAARMVVLALQVSATDIFAYVSHLRASVWTRGAYRLICVCVCADNKTKWCHLPGPHRHVCVVVGSSEPPPPPPHGPKLPALQCTTR